ncbi:ABC transporter ATP-binding protein [Thiolinea disciformis]|uniref:ABC transporter ATP-binding protein n=1 Tax=Thiolinea disciformis TaxID=125614 RepID=UPI000361205A|nr:ABC transporter ATP-binding protein [Thiolinea disciformis]
MSELILQDVQVRYAQKIIIPQFNLNLDAGMIGCLLGPSGCGKTTLLRAIAGFEAISAGSIHLAQQIISSPDVHMPTEQRSIGMVFQDYALFPHLNIAANISFGIRHLNTTMRQKRVKTLLALVNLSGYEKRYPHELSGGQQQRIALARALAPRPRLLLLDEPFGSQDVALREALAVEVRDILKHEGTTAILVTHDQQEAFAMADRIAVIHEGMLQQYDSASHLYHQPSNTWVAQFIGQGVLVPAQLNQANNLQTAWGELPLRSAKTFTTQSLQILIRPEAIQLTEHGSFQAKIVKKTFRGADVLYSLRLADQSELLASSAEAQFLLDQEVRFSINTEQLIVFEKD